MTTRPRTLAALAVALAAVAASTLPWRSGLLWNTTASAPLGLYDLRPTDAPAVGDWVAVRPPEPLSQWLDTAGFLPDGALLLKRVAARGPAVVCRSGDAVFIDGRRVAEAADRDRRGRPLPSWRGCHRLRRDQVFLLNPAAGSLDGRYFGPLPTTAIRARAVPLWPLANPKPGG